MADQGLGKISRTKRTSSADNSNIRYERRYIRSAHDDLKKGLGEIKHESSEVIEQLSGIEELEEFASMKVKAPDFPIILFLTALVFDVMDLADFSFFGYFIMLIIKIIFVIYLFFWMNNKLGTMFRTGSKVLFKTKFGKKILIKTARKFLTRRLAYIFVFNLIPILGILASNAFFVFLAHNHMNKMAQTYIKLIENVSAKVLAYKRSNR